jgi:hypothetical protein
MHALARRRPPPPPLVPAQPPGVAAASRRGRAPGRAPSAAAAASTPRLTRAPPAPLAPLPPQLTPLPRVILEFEHSARRRSRDHGHSHGHGHGHGHCRGARWPGAPAGRGLAGHGGSGVGAPDATLLALGEPLPSPSFRTASSCQQASGGGGAFGGAFAEIEAAAVGAGGVVVDGRELSGVRAAPAEATASLGTDDLPADCGPAVAAAVSETHLLQFGAMLGEATCREALARAEAAGPVGSGAGSLYGAPDTDAFFGPWDAVVQEAAPGLLYWGWRRPLRRGLFMYMTRSVFLGVTPGELRAFMMDDASRLKWDRSMSALGPALRPARGAAAPQRETDVLHAAVRFPKPLASRSYTYARRVWARPCDGGCYVLARAAAPPPGAGPPPRGVGVSDYASGAVIRAPAAALLGGHAGPAAECLMIYFEDSHVRAGFANLGIKKGLWPMLQRTDRALRSYLRTGGAVADDGGAGSAPGSPRCGSPRAGCGGGKGGCADGKGGAGAVAGWLRAATRALRALASAAGALWEAHARVASLLPRMELRLLRWLVGRAAGGLTLSSSAAAAAGRARLPHGPAASAAAAPVSSPPRLVRVASHPLVDVDGAATAAPRPAAPAGPAPPRLQVRIAAPAPAAAAPSPAAPSPGSAASAPCLRRVGSHPLTLDDLAGVELPDSPPPAAAGRPPLPLPSPLRRASSCGEALAEALPAPAVAPSAPGLERRGSGGLAGPPGGRPPRPPCAPRPSYAASCPAGSCAGSDVSGPTSSAGGASCGPPGGARPVRRRAHGRLVVRLIGAAGARVASRVLSTADTPAGAPPAVAMEEPQP